MAPLKTRKPETLVIN